MLSSFSAFFFFFLLQSRAIIRKLEPACLNDRKRRKQSLKLVLFLVSTVLQFVSFRRLLFSLSFVGRRHETQRCLTERGPEVTAHLEKVGQYFLSLSFVASSAVITILVYYSLFYVFLHYFEVYLFRFEITFLLRKKKNLKYRNIPP